MYCTAMVSSWPASHVAGVWSAPMLARHSFTIAWVRVRVRARVRVRVRLRLRVRVRVRVSVRVRVRVIFSACFNAVGPTAADLARNSSTFW